MPLDIDDYALIGDCETAALVGRDGSIDWLCWPRFDSDACLAALLGNADNGCWMLAPDKSEDVTVTRHYRPDTLILETVFETPTGRVLIQDFMPPRQGRSNLVRRALCERGTVSMRMQLTLRFEYGLVVPWVSRIDARAIKAIAGPDMVIVRSDRELRGENLTTVSEFDLHSGESAYFAMTYSPSHLPTPEALDIAAAFDDCEQAWHRWVGKSAEEGRCKEVVMRSLITLRALIYAPTGGIVAAPTTSLPESPGGNRNWDYRICWLRDATLTLLALLNAGFHDEARAWRAWLTRAIAGSPSQMQIMYGLAGERRLTEWEVPWLEGYQGAKPVRVGNAAHAQLQLDVYGEVMDALYQARKAGIDGDEVSWSLQKIWLEDLEDKWHLADSGIWEMRGPPQHFTYSKVMTWVAFDRAVRSVEEFQLDGPVERWRELREQIGRDVCAHGYDEELGSFVQAYGSRYLDASLLLLAPLGFIAADDPRYRSTVSAIEKHLLRGGFVMRYDTQLSDDGLPPGEGVFLACSFWLVDAYAMLGRTDEAHRLFERLLTVRNDLGLLAEEFDPATGHLMGNFPQAFSHIGLITSAHNLFHADKPAQQRPSTGGTSAAPYDQR